MITDDTAWLLVEACRVLDRPSRGIVVCELGSQNVGRGHISGPARWIWQWLGATYHCFDLDGQCGAERLDLSLPLPEEWHGRADVVTNFGTTEHVNTSMDFRDQWQAFANMHALAKPRAVLMHSIPNPRGEHAKCRYVYPDDFLERYAAVCGYKLVHRFEPKSDWNCHAGLLLKTETTPAFPAFDAWQAATGVIRLR